MAQTTGAILGDDFSIEVSSDGSDWDAISGSVSSIDAPTQIASVIEQHTADGDAPLVEVGPKERVEITVNAVYTEVTGEAFELVRAAWDGTRSLWLRYSPKGGSATEFMFTTASGAGVAAAGRVSSFGYPGLNADGSAFVMFTFTISAATLLKSVVSA